MSFRLPIPSGGTAGNFVQIGSNGMEIADTNQPQFNQTPGGVGGAGADATLGKVADTGGPTTAAQNGWFKIKDAAGADCWIPFWK